MHYTLPIIAPGAETWAPSTATSAFAALPNRKCWVEGDPGFLSSDGGYLFDRGGAARYSVPAGALSSGDALSTGRKGLVFDGSQSVDLGAIFPTLADYHVFVAYRQGATVAGGAGAGGGMGLVSSAAADGALYRSLYVDSVGADTGRPIMSHAGSPVYAGDTAFAIGAVRTMHASWINASKARNVMIDGADASTTPSGTANNATNNLSSAIIGRIGNLADTFNFAGSIFHLSIFGTLTTAEQAAARAYLVEQYT